MIHWSIDILVRAGCAPVIVAVPPNLLEHARGLLPPGVATVVAGGPSRQQTVAAALEHVDGRRVLVHDASRPLIMFWTGFLRVGAQSALLLAPPAALLLMLRWLG